MTIIDTLEGYEIDTKDPYTILGEWFWVATDVDSGQWIALTTGDESYQNLVDGMEEDELNYEIITAGWWK